jgi:methionyl-tRNA formyltransferase
VRNGADVVGVLGLSASRAGPVSGYARLDDIAAQTGAEYRDFEKVNTPEVIDALQRWQPDVLFAVGISQLVATEVRATARVGCVGFHPTALPVGRGRAPIAWIVLDGVPAAASFFELVDEADAGGILVQEPFDVGPTPTASSVLADLDLAIDRALDRWLPSLLAGEWAPVAQDEARATTYGRRTAADGAITWSDAAVDIERLIRAAGRPHPGAFTRVGDRVVRVWAAHVVASPEGADAGRVTGGSVDAGLVVQTGHGALALDEIEIEPPCADGDEPLVRIGDRLG